MNPDSLHQLIVTTPYCWPITNIQSLREASLTLKSRAADDLTDASLRGISVAHAVDEYLDNTSGESSQIPALTDDNGHIVIFLHLLTPIARERGRELEILEDAANDKPLLISMLLPEAAFNLSELEVAYEVNAHDVLEEQFGEEATAGHTVIHSDSVYIDSSATFYLLLHMHPALFISLSHAVIFRSSVQTRQISETLRDTTEQLRRIDQSITDLVFLEIPSQAVQQAYGACISVFEECQSILASYFSGEIEDEASPFHLRVLLGEALSTLLIDEKLTFDILLERITEIRDPHDAMEVFDEAYSSSISQAPQPQTVIIDQLYRICRQIRRTRRRLKRLSFAIPSDVEWH